LKESKGLGSGGGRITHKKEPAEGNNPQLGQGARTEFILVECKKEKESPKMEEVTSPSMELNLKGGFLGNFLWGGKNGQVFSMKRA